MKPPANAIQIVWQRTVDGNPALSLFEAGLSEVG